MSLYPVNTFANAQMLALDLDLEARKALLFCEFGRVISASRMLPVRGYAMNTRIHLIFALPALLLLWIGSSTAVDTAREPYKFFREFIGLNEDQIAAIRSGKAVAKVVESRTPDEVFVFGSVYIEA